MTGTATSVVDAPAPTPSLALVTCSVDIVTDERAFLDLEVEWNAAVDRAGLAHPFLRHEWIRTWWQCFGSGGRLHIIIVRVHGRIAAIAPLMAETVWMYGLPVRRLRLMHNEHTPRADFIVAEHPDESYRAIWAALGQATVAWDVLQLGQLPQQSPTCETIRAQAAADGCGIGVWHSGDAPYLELAGSWDQYFDARSAKFRQNVRNRLSRLKRIGAPVLETLDDAGDIMAAREDAFRLEASGWKDDAGTSVSANPAVHRFYSLLAERASTRGWLRLLFLRINGRRIAVSYGSLYANRLFLFKTGYDPEYAQCSPFKLLTYFALHDAFAAGLSEVDFLGDAEPWKLEWTATVRPHDWLFVFARSSRAGLLCRAKFQVLPAWKRWRG
jgi:CelD/BcsL family acetyltransferase involved in cellulose biosynthesis